MPSARSLAIARRDLHSCPAHWWLEGQRDSVFAELPIARTFFNHVDREMQRLGDLRHALGIVAGPAIVQRAANTVAVGQPALMVFVKTPCSP